MIIHKNIGALKKPRLQESSGGRASGQMCGGLRFLNIHLLMPR